MSSQKPYLLIVCPFALPNLGGVESHIDKLIKYATVKGYYVVLVTYQPLTRKIKGKYHEYNINYEIHRIWWFGYDLFNKFEKYFLLQFLYLFPGLFIGSVYYYLKYLGKFTCIHAHGLVAAVVTRLLLKIKNIKSVISTHAVYNFNKHPYLAYTVKRILNRFDVVLAVSKISKEELIKLGISQTKLDVHPNWVDTTVFKLIDRYAARKKLNINYTINMLFVGRFIDKKGIELFAQTAAELHDIGFHAAGSGPMLEKIIEITKAVPNFIYYGALMQDSPTDLEKLILLYNACDYFVSPYLYDEGFSTTLIESLACGTKNIITDRGSPPTFLTDHVAIKLSSAPNKNELIHVIKNLTNDINYNRMECRNFATENFGFKNADVIINSYKN